MSEAESSRSTRSSVGASRNSIIQRLTYWVFWGFLLVFISTPRRFRRHNVERIPKTGGCLLICNHQSFFDPPLVGFCMTGRQMHSLARIGLFKVPLFGHLIRYANAIPIRQDGGDRAAIREALDRLAGGAAVLVFPEGSRTPDGEVHSFQRGVALLVGKASCPVVPMAINGAYGVWPRTSRFPRLWGGNIDIAVGHPIEHDELLKDGAPAALQRLEAEVASLLDSLKEHPE